MIGIGNDVWIDPESVESLRRVPSRDYEMRVLVACYAAPTGKPFKPSPPGDDEFELVVTMRSGEKHYLPKDWNEYDLFRQMYPD